MRFDVFDRFGPGFFGKKAKVRSPASRKESTPKDRDVPGSQPQRYAISDDVVDLDHTLAGCAKRTLRSLDRHARWQAVNAMTHSGAKH
jgi:hypothetical protein